jgi:hypothetical protein
MTMNEKEFEKLIDVVKAPIPEGLNIISGSVPIPFFGDFDKAKVCTIGINPGRSEFMRIWPKKQWPKGHPKHREACFNKADTEALSEENAKEVIGFCKDYFKRFMEKKGEIDKFFRNLETIVQKFPGCDGYSYLGGNIVHLDIVPWATDPDWGKLPQKAQEGLEQFCQDREYFRILFGAKQFKYVFLNGTTVREVFTKTGTYHLTESSVDYTVSEPCYFGNEGGVNIIGWNTFIGSGRQAKNPEAMGAAIAERYGTCTKAGQ